VYIILGEVLAILWVIRVADVVERLDEAVRVVLSERDAELDDLVGLRRAGVGEARRGVVAALVDVPATTLLNVPIAANTPRRSQRRESKEKQGTGQHGDS
jgi:hypothetical protein